MKLQAASPGAWGGQIRTSKNYKWYALAAVMIGTLMGPFDGSVVNVALATIGRAFNTTVDSTEWILLAYFLAIASTVVLAGRIGDLVGQRRVYLWGFVVFGLSSLACAFAPAFWMLIAARAVQGLGSAMLAACTMAIVTAAFPEKERGRAIGFNGAAVAVGLTCGPVIGGLIVTHAHWRWIFLINVPISVIALIVAASVLRTEEKRPATLDLYGAALLGSALFTVSLALSRAHVWGWASPITVAPLAYAAVATAAFILVEQRVASPIVDLRLFLNSTFALSVSAATLYFCAIFAVIFTVPISAQIVLKLDGLRAGLLLLPISALNVVLAPVAGALSDRVSARYVSTAGALLFATGSLIVVLLAGTPAPWMIVAALIVAGCGTASFSQPNNSAIMGSAPADQRGVAGGILATARTTGQLLGVALAGAVYFPVAAHLGPQDFGAAKAVFALVALLMLVVTITSFVRE